MYILAWEAARLVCSALSTVLDMLRPLIVAWLSPGYRHPKICNLQKNTQLPVKILRLDGAPRRFVEGPLVTAVTSQQTLECTMSTDKEN